MGDWQGEDADGKALCVQVIAETKDIYRANIMIEFDMPKKRLAVLNGSRSGDKVVLSGNRKGSTWSAILTEGSFKGRCSGDRETTFDLKPVTRLSPTLGKEPPANAVILFDGTSLDSWMQVSDGKPIQWKLLEGGVMEVGKGGIVSKHGFKDHTLHLEFRTPFMPGENGQGRGNSGAYFQGRYEVQILDSYGLKTTWNDCGAIYNFVVPKINMAAPPLQWQTYDITFHAPRFDADGAKTKDATLTVLHNGVLIHENEAVPEPTRANIGGDIREAQGLHLQDHGNPVQYRNIWAVEIN